jgi:hypothetical protein
MNGMSTSAHSELVSIVAWRSHWSTNDEIFNKQHPSLWLKYAQSGGADNPSLMASKFPGVAA